MTNRRVGGICSEGNCHDRHHAFGFCRKHYEYHKRQGNLDDSMRRNCKSVSSRMVYKPGQMCSIPHCNNKAKVRGICHSHMNYIRAGRDPNVILMPVKGRNRMCDILHCDRRHHAKGYCRLHYNRKRKKLDMNALPYLLPPKAKEICKKPGCKNNVRARGLCRRHYEADRRHSIPEIEHQCSVDGCHKRHKAFGYCHSHYNKFRNQSRES